MDFIRLYQVLRHIGAEIKYPELLAQKYPDLDYIYQESEAAAILHQQLHNYPELRPKWVMLHDVTDRPVFDDTVADVGMELLVAKAGSFKRNIGVDYSKPSFEITKRKFPIPPFEQRPNGYKDRGSLSTIWNEIGFDRFELIRFLDDPRVGIDYSICLTLFPFNVQSKRLLPERQQQRESLRAVDGPPDMPGMDEARTERRTAPKLALPDKSDAWAKAIEATYELMVQELVGTPKGTEVWLRMNDTPPANYPIKATKDHGLPAITMQGEKPLTRDGFMKRWARYTGTK